MKESNYWFLAIVLILVFFGFYIMIPLCIIRTYPARFEIFFILGYSIGSAMVFMELFDIERKKGNDIIG